MNQSKISLSGKQINEMQLKQLAFPIMPPASWKQKNDSSVLYWQAKEEKKTWNIWPIYAD